MPYSVEILPRSRWEELKDFGHFKATACLPDPDSAVVLVLRDEAGKIVGSWFATTLVLLEGLFIDPEHRNKPAAAKRLLLGMIELLKEREVKSALTVTVDPVVRRMAGTAGFQEIDGTLHLLTLKESGEEE